MSMADHARELGVTPTHLTRVCKAQTGQTAAALLTGRLVHASRTLLEETKFPARDIARHLGFNSAAYFSRFVAQHCGCSPSALRNPNERR
jgi:AraC family transcriptional activator of pobA